VRLNFLGVFNFNAPFLPWVLLGMSLIINAHFPMNDALGITIGHIYYFMDDVYPVTSRTGRRYLRAPELL
jgi:Derlin-2/3